MSRHDSLYIKKFRTSPKVGGMKTLRILVPPKLSYFGRLKKKVLLGKKLSEADKEVYELLSAIFGGKRRRTR